MLRTTFVSKSVLNCNLTKCPQTEEYIIMLILKNQFFLNLKNLTSRVVLILSIFFLLILLLRNDTYNDPYNVFVYTCKTSINLYEIFFFSKTLMIFTVTRIKTNKEIL